MNLPNRLTIARILMVPLFIFFALFTFSGEHADLISRLLSAGVFLLAAVTDFADGKIARKYNIITDFGKFLDPLADKFLIFAAILVFLFSDRYAQGEAFRLTLFISGAIVIFRELAVTSLRLVVAGSDKHVVISASFFGKAKTFSQCVWVLIVILEPVIFPFFDTCYLSWLSTVVMSILTVLSGIDYMRSYWRYLNPNK